MKVLMISGDKNILDPTSPVYKRFELQKSQVERLDVFVWPQVHSVGDILKAVRAHSYDVVTAQDPFWRGFLAWRVARRSGAKLNLQVHTDLKATFLFRRLLARFLLRRADSIRVVSERIKEYLAPLHLHANVSILPIYIDLTSFARLPHRPHPRFQKTILWIGRFEPEKDPLLALSVLKQVRDAGVDVGLIMLGSGSLESKLRVQAAPLASYVEFPGWQGPAPYLEMVDVVISTSKHESYGVSVIEALASGVPVVSPDVGIAREAGAMIASRPDLAARTVDVLRSGVRGELKLTPLSAEVWAQQWRETL